MKRVVAALALAFLLLPTPSLEGQFSAEGRVGIALPGGDDFGDAASTGFGLEATGIYAFTSVVEGYVGLSWTRYGAEGDEEVEDADWTDSGLSVGARILIPTESDLHPWLRGGLTLNTLELSASEQGVSASVESDRTLGFEVGGGIGIEVSENFLLTPGVRFRSYSPEFDVGAASGQADDINSFVLDVGARISL